MAKFSLLKPPRRFQPTQLSKVKINEVARIELATDEQVCLVTSMGSEYDILRKEWGYYATPSINKRLSENGFDVYLVKNSLNHFFLMLVMMCKYIMFVQYCEKEGLTIVIKLDENTFNDYEKITRNT